LARIEVEASRTRTFVTKKITENTAVILTVDATITGASVGDSGAWLLRDSRIVDLTAGQRRKPLVGRGCAPFRIEPIPFDGTLLVASDGLFAYAKPRDIVRSTWRWPRRRWSTWYACPMAHCRMTSRSYCVARRERVRRCARLTTQTAKIFGVFRRARLPGDARRIVYRGRQDGTGRPMEMELTRFTALSG
jgi:hypothetical protein